MEQQMIKNHIDNYMREFEQTVYHPNLNREIGQPKLDDFTVFFLLLPKLNKEEWTESMNTAAIAVGAVYAAFTVHDTIDRVDATNPKQQLAVLSGDYLSGIYYKLLAELPDFNFIHTLSKAIGQINEVKTEFYHGDAFHVEAYLDAIKTIQTECVTQFLHTFGFSKYVPLVEAAFSLSSMMMMMMGREEAKQAGHFMHDLRISESQMNDAIGMLEEKVERALLAADFIEPFLAEQIRHMTTPLLGKTI